MPMRWPGLRVSVFFAFLARWFFVRGPWTGMVQGSRVIFVLKVVDGRWCETRCESLCLYWRDMVLLVEVGKSKAACSCQLQRGVANRFGPEAVIGGDQSTFTFTFTFTQ